MLAKSEFESTTDYKPEHTVSNGNHTYLYRVE